jgi:hypothetical protein
MDGLGDNSDILTDYGIVMSRLDFGYCNQHTAVQNIEAFGERMLCMSVINKTKQLTPLKLHTVVFDPVMCEDDLALRVGDILRCTTSVPFDVMFLVNFPDRSLIPPRMSTTGCGRGEGRVFTFGWIGHRGDKYVSGIEVDGCGEGKCEKGEKGEKESRERRHDHNNLCRFVRRTEVGRWSFEEEHLCCCWYLYRLELPGSIIRSSSRHELPYCSRGHSNTG